MVRKSKKAMEMSINLIIMLIIGMVVLGLVIAFVNSLVSDAQESFQQNLGAQEQAQLNKVKECSGNLCVEPTPKVFVKKGEDTSIFIKSRGFGPTTDIACNPGPLASCTQYAVSFSDSAGTAATGFTLSGPGFQVVKGEEDSQMYTLKTDGAVPIGTYYMTTSLTIDSKVETKSVTLIVE